MGVSKMTCLFLALLMGCQATSLQWWQTASFYQIYPRSFKDSDGDGVGDLKGITQQLHYLKEIGVTATWLSPIFTSPMADFGYDVANLTEIDTLFGTMADFEALIARAKELGVKILLDFVPNHTSDECEWFIKSAANDSFYRDFYVWHPGKIVDGVRQPPNSWISVFRGSAWTFNEQRGEYYLHQFHHKQPDLNYRNPLVIEAMKNVLRFWLRKGASGFRVDAIPHTFEIAADSEGNYPDEPRNPNVNDPEDYEYFLHIYTKDQPETVDLIYQFRQVLDEMKLELEQEDDFIMMTEAYTALHNVMEYYGNETHNGAQIPFNFELLTNLKKESTAFDYDKHINDWLSNMPEQRTANWVMGNHDNSRIATRLGEDRVDIINILLMTLPGCSVTYQGEEIGMSNVWISWEDTQDPQACQSNPENYERLTRDPTRSPFQWNNQPFAGFTSGNSTWLPVSDNYPFVNVQSERDEYLSHLQIYKKVKFLRKNIVFQLGSTEVRALSEGVLGIKRSLLGKSSFVILLNLGDDLETFDLFEHFDDITPRMKYVVATRNSARRAGIVTSSRFIAIRPKSAVILRTLKSFE